MGNATFLKLLHGAFWVGMTSQKCLEVLDQISGFYKIFFFPILITVIIVTIHSWIYAFSFIYKLDTWIATKSIFQIIFYIFWKNFSLLPHLFRSSFLLTQGQQRAHNETVLALPLFLIYLSRSYSYFLICWLFFSPRIF